MANQQDDLLLSLQSSLRNTLHTFGPSSPQYANIKQLVDERIAKISQGPSAEKKDEAQPENGKPWGGNLVFRVKGQ